MLFKKNQLLVFLFTIIFSSFTFSQITCNDTSWGKAIDFNGSNEHAKQVSPSSDVNAVRMYNSNITCQPNSSDKTSNDGSAAPWAVAIVFKAEVDTVLINISGNSGEGANTNNDNMYLEEITIVGSLRFGWGRVGE